MTIERKEMKMRRTNNSQGRNRSVDRLSSLPSDILIGIVSLLPLRLAITTGSLSRRWRNLWTNTTSIDIAHSDFKNLDYKLGTSLNEIMTQITSPVIHSLRMEYNGILCYNFWVTFIDNLIRKVCDRNVHILKVTWPTSYGWYTKYRLPSVVFKIQSLVSVELGATYCRDLQFPDDCDTINLPNLKKLNIHFTELQWIEKLVEACPSLEELSLYYGDSSLYWLSLPRFECSNQNLRQLFINIYLKKRCTIVINAPNLESLAISTPKSVTFSFEAEPILLRETKIEFRDLHRSLSDKKKVSKFDGAISNVQYLTLDVSAVSSLSSMVFRNATRLTLNMKLSRSLNTLSSIIEMCPVLEVLTLNVWCVEEEETWLQPKPENVSTLRRSLKRINIEIDKWDICCKPAESVLQLVEYLLRDAPDLERFSVIDCTNGVLRRNVRRKQEHEFKLCKLLYWCPMVSTCCDVEFKGKILNMSQKDGPKVTTAKGKVMYFLRSRIGLNYKQH